MGEYIVMTTSGERVGSQIEEPWLPATGDILVLGFPWDSGTGPYRVVRREFVNREWFVIVEHASPEDSAAAAYLQHGGD